MRHSACKIEGCQSRVFARGWCGTHYHRWRSHGDPICQLKGYCSIDELPSERRSIDRYPGYLFCSDGSVWTCRQPAGMGHGMKLGSAWKRLKPGKRKGYLGLTLSLGTGETESIPLHVAIAEAFLGPKPDPSIDCCHNDGNRLNCALDNLRYDTKKGNNSDKRKHGTMYGGERHHDAKLTEALVIEIRKAYGTEPVTEIAKRHGVSTRTAWGAIRRETWKHVP